MYIDMTTHVCGKIYNLYKVQSSSFPFPCECICSYFSNNVKLYTVYPTQLNPWITQPTIIMYRVMISSNGLPLYNDESEVCSGHNHRGRRPRWLCMSRDRGWGHGEDIIIEAGGRDDYTEPWPRPRSWRGSRHQGRRPRWLEPWTYQGFIIIKWWSMRAHHYPYLMLSYVGTRLPPDCAYA